MIKRIAYAVRDRFPSMFASMVRGWQGFNGLVRYGDPHFPRSFSIEISKFCNRTCSYCPNSEFKTPVENIQPQVYTKILSRLADIKWNGVVDFIFYNEPLLHPDIVSIVELAKAFVPNCKPRIITNGDVLTDELTRKLIDAGVLSFWVSRHVPVKPGWDNRINALKAKYGGIIQVVDLMEVQAQQGLLDRAGLVEVEKRFVFTRCTSPTSAAHITIDGTWLLCCNDYHRQNPFGNLLTRGILEIWRDPRFASIRKNLRGGVATLKICKNCISPQP